MRRLLIGVRNFAADVWAAAVFGVPALEPLFLITGKALHRIPLLTTVYRRARDTYRGKLKAQGRQFRTIKAGTVRFLFDISEYGIGESYFLGQAYEPKTTMAFVEHVKPGDVVVDIGVNAGYFSLVAATLAGSTGRVYGFEPNPAVRELALEHLRRNTLEKVVEIIPVALSNVDQDSVEFWIPTGPLQSGLATLDRATAEGWKGVRIGEQEASFSRVMVPCTRFDTWVRDNPLPRIDFMKVDVEGFEHQVFLGMADTFKRTPPKVIVCETLPDSPADRLLMEIGYRRQELEAMGGTWNNLLYIRSSPDE